MLDALRALWQPEPIIALQRIFGPAWRPVLEVLSLLGGHQLVVLALCWARWFRGRHLACRLLVEGKRNNCQFPAGFAQCSLDFDVYVRVAETVSADG